MSTLNVILCGSPERALCEPQGHEGKLKPTIPAGAVRIANRREAYINVCSPMRLPRIKSGVSPGR